MASTVAGSRTACPRANARTRARVSLGPSGSISSVTAPSVRASCARRIGRAGSSSSSIGRKLTTTSRRRASAGSASSRTASRTSSAAAWTSSTKITMVRRLPESTRFAISRIRAAVCASRAERFGRSHTASARPLVSLVANVSRSRVLPQPASPQTSTTEGWPRAAAFRRAINSAIWGPRPMRSTLAFTPAVPNVSAKACGCIRRVLSGSRPARAGNDRPNSSGGSAKRTARVCRRAGRPGRPRVPR